jgi:hypothetical protein
MKGVAYGGAAEDVSDGAGLHGAPHGLGQGSSHPVESVEAFYRGDYGIQRVHGSS